MFFDKEEGDEKTVFTLQGKVVKEAVSYKYLGVMISNGENYLEEMEKNLLKKTNKLKGITTHTATFSYNAYSVGRMIWKMVAVPSMTYSNEVTTIGQQTQNQLERAQREVGRKILGGNWITPNPAIEGEMGWSTLEAREAKSKIKFKGRLVYMNENRFPKVVYNYLRFSGTETKWTRRVKNLDKRYGKDSKRKTNTTYQHWKEETENDVKRNQEEKWKEEVEKKKSLCLYKVKERPKEEILYDNSRGSSLLFQARAGALRTEKRLMEVFGGVDNGCKSCEGKKSGRFGTHF